MKEQATVRLESMQGAPVRAETVARALAAIGVRVRSVPMTGTGRRAGEGCGNCQHGAQGWCRKTAGEFPNEGWCRCWQRREG